MTDNIKRTLYRLDKGFSLVLYKERAPIALPSILINQKKRATGNKWPKLVFKDLYYTNNIAQVRD